MIKIAMVAACSVGLLISFFAGAWVAFGICLGSLGATLFFVKGKGS